MAGVAEGELPVDLIVDQADRTAAVGLAAVALLVAGALLSRTTSGSSWGVGLILAPLTGVVPVAVFVAAGVAADVGTSL